MESDTPSPHTQLSGGSYKLLLILTSLSTCVLVIVRQYKCYHACVRTGKLPREISFVCIPFQRIGCILNLVRFGSAAAICSRPFLFWFFFGPISENIAFKCENDWNITQRSKRKVTNFVHKFCKRFNYYNNADFKVS